MSDAPKVDSKIHKRFQDVGTLITKRNELVEARAASYSASFSYANNRVGEAGRFNIELEMDEQEKVKELFILIIDDKLRKIDDQLRNQGLGSLIEE
ncbi:MAG: hypothetical protein V4606_03650 [Patescibacteria group bacterium]